MCEGISIVTGLSSKTLVSGFEVNDFTQNLYWINLAAHLVDHGLTSAPDDDSQALNPVAGPTTRKTRSVSHKALLDIYLTTLPANRFNFNGFEIFYPFTY